MNGYSLVFLGLAVAALAACAVAGAALPIARSARKRLAEASVILLVLLGCPELPVGFLQGPVVPFGVVLFLLGRVVHARPATVEASASFGAHALYAVPLLAVAVSRCWELAQHGERLGWGASAVIGMGATLNNRNPRWCSVGFSLLVLAGSAAVSALR